MRPKRSSQGHEPAYQEQQTCNLLRESPPPDYHDGTPFWEGPRMERGQEIGTDRYVTSEAMMRYSMKVYEDLRKGVYTYIL